MSRPSLLQGAPGRRAGILSLVCVGLAIAGCVVIPYQPEAETRRELAEVAHPHLIRLSAQPQQRLEDIGHELHRADVRIEPASPQAFVEAAAAEGEFTLAQLLDPATGARLESLNLDYLVLVAAPEHQDLRSWGEVVFYLGFFGAQSDKTSSTFGAALIDLRQQRLVARMSSTATGTDRAIGLFYGLFIASDEEGGAQRGLVREVVEAFGAEQPQGPVRIVILAAEAIKTPEQLAAEGAAAARAERQTRQFYITSVAEYPPFAEPAAFPAGQGLVYLYRPEHFEGSLWPLVMWQRTKAGAFETVSLWSGGYLPLFVPAGSVELWAAADPQQMVALNVEPGATYYVRAIRRTWTLKRIAPRLEVVAADVGSREVAACRRLPPTGEYVGAVRELAEQGYTHKQLELARLYAAGVVYGPGQGLPRDPGEAYMWYSIVDGSALTRPEWREQARQGQELLVASLTATQRADAELRARSWLDAPGEERP